MTNNCTKHNHYTDHNDHIGSSSEVGSLGSLPSSICSHPAIYHHADLLDEELALEAIIEDLRQPSLSHDEKQKLSEKALGKLENLCKTQEMKEAKAISSAQCQKLRADKTTDQAINHTRSNHSRLTGLGIAYFLAFMVGILKIMTAEYVFAAAATLNFDQGLTDGVNPILDLILDHNGKAIFLSSAMGMLLGGGGGTSDGWARLKMGGLWAVGAAAMIHIMKGTLGV